MKYVIRVFRKSTNEVIGVYRISAADFEMSVMWNDSTPLQAIENITGGMFAPSLHNDWRTETRIEYS